MDYQHSFKKETPFSYRLSHSPITVKRIRIMRMRYSIGSKPMSSCQHTEHTAQLDYTIK